MYHDKIIKKIPGIPPPLLSKDNRLEDLKKLSNVELKELITRQEKLSSNKSFLKKLPDRGEKILKLLDTLKQEQIQRNEISNVNTMLNALRISGDDAEWSNASNVNNYYSTDGKLSGFLDDRCISASVTKEKEVTCVEDPYTEQVIKKVDKSVNKSKERFKPNTTSKSSAPTVEKQQKVELSMKKEITAATPPLLVHSDIRLLSLAESVALQKEHAMKLKDAQVKQAKERLAEHCVRHGNLVPELSGQTLYRQKQQSSSESSQNESGDEEKQAFEEEEEHENDVAVVVSLVDS